MSLPGTDIAAGGLMKVSQLADATKSCQIPQHKLAASKLRILILPHRKRVGANIDGGGFGSNASARSDNLSHLDCLL